MSREQNWYIRRYVRAVSTFLPCSGEMPTADLLAELHIRRRLVAVTAIALAAALAVYIVALAWQAYLIHDSLNGWSETYVVEYENIVTEEAEQ